MDHGSSRRDRAEAYFLEGYNCSQSVALAFADLVPVERKQLAALASSFGGGMGRLREVCGACTGAFIILGLLYGCDGPTAGPEKAEHYARIQGLAKAFAEKNGSFICRELLGRQAKYDTPVPDARTKEYYAARPCAALVGCAAELTEQYIREHPVKA